MHGVVYKIVDMRTPEVALYVGSTIGKLAARWNRHKYDVKRAERKYKLVEYLRRHGVDNFQVVKIRTVECRDKRQLAQFENEDMRALTPSLNTRQAHRGWNAPQNDETWYSVNKDNSKKYEHVRYKNVRGRRVTCGFCSRTVTAQCLKAHQQTCLFK
jgi:Uri superfamily endonuclease